MSGAPTSWDRNTLILGSDLPFLFRVRTRNRAPLSPLDAATSITCSGPHSLISSCCFSFCSSFHHCSNTSHLPLSSACSPGRSSGLPVPGAMCMNDSHSVSVGSPSTCQSSLPILTRSPGGISSPVFSLTVRAAACAIDKSSGAISPHGQCSWPFRSMVSAMCHPTAVS